MRRRERVEIGLVVLAAVAACAAERHLPASLDRGELVLLASVLLLGQGLVRDVVARFAPRRSAPAACVLRGGAVVCAESSVGISGIVAAALLLFAGAPTPCILRPGFWPAAVLCVGLVGFLMKDLVVDARARRLRRVTDHASIEL